MNSPNVRPAVFRTYWAFAAERQRIFEARVRDEPSPWTDDPILTGHRFCNAFRASDRVSQDLIRVVYDPRFTADEDVFVRVVLHRLFSRPATFRRLDLAVGGVSSSTFNVADLGSMLDELQAGGEKLYTGAFILCANRAYGFQRKHWNHLTLIDRMLDAGVPHRIGAADSLEAVYRELKGWPLLGPFMAYQLAIDLNYSPLIDFDEDEFTVPGPGAVRGLRKVFTSLNGLTPSEAIHWLVAYQQRAEEELGIEPPTLFGRRLKAIDCQNLLCEVDKYCRVKHPELESDRTRIKQRFRADPEPIRLFFPPKWGLDVSSAPPTTDGQDMFTACP